MMDYPVSIPSFEITVNSPVDGEITPDQFLTLREAITLANGDLSLEALSPTEQALVSASDYSRIHFALPATETTIHLVASLPTLTQPMAIDGTTQPGYEPTVSTGFPLVAITPAADTEIARGLTLSANQISIHGLSLYGFTSEHQATASQPPGDIVIDRLHKDAPIPTDILIEQNWLGLPPTETMPEKTSAFGINILQGQLITIIDNNIAYHDGSGILTSLHATQMTITENVIDQNGRAGMPDAIRLEGDISDSIISHNSISSNGGSAIFMFKPQGSVNIHTNDIFENGQRLERSAIYVMGSNHQITDNAIVRQNGPGVVVTAYGQGPNNQSIGNRIENNTFSSLQGLSIDLNTRRHREIQAFQIGDGPNPVRDSDNRRRDTGNGAVNAPRFLSHEFLARIDHVVIEGTADPGTTIQIYRVSPDAQNFGHLSELLTTINTDAQGYFAYTATELMIGDTISAIATDAYYGTSEPARNAVISTLNASSP
jgi:Right handed beta helix region